MKTLFYTRPHDCTEGMVEKPDEVSYCGIYDNSKYLHSYEFLMNNDSLQAMINLARSKDKQFDPMVWMISISKNTPLFNNNLLITLIY